MTQGNRANTLPFNRHSYARNSPTSLTDPSGLTPGNKALAQAVSLCEANGWSTCATITPDMAEEMLHGNATAVDWTNPRDALRDPVDAALFSATAIGTDGRTVFSQPAERRLAKALVGRGRSAQPIAQGDIKRVEGHMEQITNEAMPQSGELQGGG